METCGVGFTKGIGVVTPQPLANGEKKVAATSMVTRFLAGLWPPLRLFVLSAVPSRRLATRGPWFIVGTVRSVRVCKFGIFALMFRHVWARKISDTYIYIYLYLDPRNLQKKVACDFKARVCNENLGF